MKPSPAFQLYPQDFLVGTAELTAEEVGAYIRLLCYQWVKGGLPSEDKKLMHLSGITDPYVMGNVSVKFRLCPDGMLRNERLEQVRANLEEYRQKQIENGQKGGNPNFKKGKHNPYYNPPLSSGDNPPHNPKINSSSSSSSSSSSIKKEEKKALEVLIPENLKTESFKETWNKWVDFRKKKKACKDWKFLFQEQLNQLSVWGEAMAIQSLKSSMLNDWQGIFEPKGNISNRVPAVSRPSFEEAQKAQESIQ